MRKELFWSVARKALIVALLVSAALLFSQTEYFSASKRRLSAGEITDGDNAASAASASAEAAVTLLPRAVMVRFPGGGAVASAFDGENTEDSFRRFSAVLGEALGSAGAPEEITESAFREGMDAGSVFVDLGTELPMGLLSDWLGAGGGGAAEKWSGLLYLGLAGDEVTLCFRDGDGAYYRCATATQAETLEARMEGFTASGAYFAYENGHLAGAEPYTVIMEDMPEKYAVSGGSARDYADPEILMDAMGLNGYVATSYYDADGTLVLMEGGRTLRLSPGGMLYYRSAGGESEFAPDDTVAAVNHACRLALRSAGASCGDAKLMFSGLEAGESSWSVYFDYAVDGVPVRLSDSHAGTVVVSGGTVRWASLALRRYTVSADVETVLTMYRAAAIAAARGGTPELVYADSGDRTRCMWVNN